MPNWQLHKACFNLSLFTLQVTYSITSGDPEGHFNIVITPDGIGQLVTTAALDRETIERYNLVVSTKKMNVKR